MDVQGHRQDQRIAHTVVRVVLYCGTSQDTQGERALECANGEISLPYDGRASNNFNCPLINAFELFIK